MLVKYVEKCVIGATEVDGNNRPIYDNVNSNIKRRPSDEVSVN